MSAKQIRADKRNEVLLFYKMSKVDSDPNYPNRTITGFMAWFERLRLCLELTGHKVSVNDYKRLRAEPNHPVGIVGHAKILDTWNYRNPAVLGPSLLDHPKIYPRLMQRKNFKFYLVTCDWFQKLFIPYYGHKCVLWRAGIETDIWKPALYAIKKWDILIYDKIRWDRKRMLDQLLQPIERMLRHKKITYTILRDGNYSQEHYKHLLNSSKSMLFLCEHETQGMSYQEALSSDLPVFAWDPGYWLDPQGRLFEKISVPATSVPYFASECGMTFRDIDEFYYKFDLFWKNRTRYKPRLYIKRELSLKKSSEIYMRYYNSLFK